VVYWWRRFKDSEDFKLRARIDVFLMREGNEKQKTIKKFEDSITEECNGKLSRWEAQEASEYNEAAPFQAAYNSLLTTLDLVQLKKLIWLCSPELNMANVALKSLKVRTAMRGSYC
jgi:valyl-tRNA synthetase